MKFTVLLPAALLAMSAQTITPPAAPQPAEMSSAEQSSLAVALGEAGNSPIEFTRALEQHLAKFPDSPKRQEIERALFRTAVDQKDVPRIARYGEAILKQDPQNTQVLEKTAVALIQTGGQDNWKHALAYARTADGLLEKSAAEPAGAGREAARRRDELDRDRARIWLVEARSTGLLGNKQEAIQLSEKSFRLYASVEAAREAARWFKAMGQSAKAVEYLADAFSIEALKAPDASATRDRREMGELYREQNGSETGLGDLVLRAYDRTAAEMAERREQLEQLDPNRQAKEPGAFTLSAVNGPALNLASLRGKVVVLDFWATWCGPCRAQHPLYKQVEQRFRDRGDVVFVPVNTDDDHSLVKPFLDANHWGNSYFDDGLGNLLKVSSIPTTVVLNRKGEVSARLNGFLPDRFTEMLSDRIREALSDNAVKHD